MGFIDRWLEEPQDRRWRERQEYRERHADRREARRAADRALDREQRAAAAAVTARQRENAALIRTYQDQEKSWYNAPRTVYVGGNNSSLKPMRVSHHAAPLPLCFLPHPDAPDQKSVVFGPGFMRSRNGSLMDDAAWRENAKATLTIWTDIKKRYLTVLGKLRDETWWRELTVAAGLTHSETSDEPWTGQYASGTRKLTTVSVPRISRVQVAEDGLRLTIALDVNVPPRKWQAAVDTLRAGFKSAGMSAGNLRVGETAAGAPLLIFDDLDPLSDVSIETGAWDDEKFRSLLGIDSKGREVWIGWRDVSGMVVGGVAGSGKTASMLPVFRGMEGNVELYVFDGKAQRDLHPLRHICRVYDNSGDIEAPLETVQMLEKLRVLRGDALYEKMGAANFWHLSSEQRRELGMKPIFVVLDEAQVWLKTSKDKEKAKIQAQILESVENLIRMGRSAGIVVIITTQRPSAESIPTDVRDNAQLKLCFKVTNDIMTQMVLGSVPKGNLDPTAIAISDKGRFVMDTEGVGMVLGQAGYISPSELESQLERAEPVPDQWAVAERFASVRPTRSADTPTPPSSSPDAAPSAAPSRQSQGQADDRPKRLTPEQVRAEAIRRGYLKPDDDETPTTAPETTPETPTDNPDITKPLEGFE